jgi:hypothetical protein
MALRFGFFLGTGRSRLDGRVRQDVINKELEVVRAIPFRLHPPNPAFSCCNLLWFWKWKGFTNFYPMRSL